MSDPSYGTAALSQPPVMSNLLKDLLPDAPREAGLLVAAAQADLAGTLRGYLAQGMDLGTAVRLTAGSFVDSTSHTPEACTWVVSELAFALGMDPSAWQATATQAPAAAQAAATMQSPVAQSPWAPPGGSPQAHGAAGWPPQAAPGWPPPGPAPQGRAPSPWPVPPPRLKSTIPPSARLAGALGLVGAFFVLLGCAVPWVRFSTGATGAAAYENVSIFSGYRGASGSATFWEASEPLAVLIAATVLGIVLLVRGSQHWFAPGMLTGFGIQTILLFAGYIFSLYSGEHREAGAGLGLLGGMVLLGAGLLGLAAARQQAGRRPQPQAAADAP